MKEGESVKEGESESDRSPDCELSVVFTGPALDELDRRLAERSRTSDATVARMDATVARPQ